MTRLFLTAFTTLSFFAQGQSIDRYFESIRNNEAELTAFFSQMPKGGDLHNHFTGSIYTETYVDYVVQQNYVVNEQTLEVRTVAPQTDNRWVSFSKLSDSGLLSVYKQKLMQKWSVKDYNGVSYPSDKQFFETFNGFGIANSGPGRLDSGLLELKRRAISENVSYIETMFTKVPCDNLDNIDPSYNQMLEEAQGRGDEKRTMELLQALYQIIEAKNAKGCAASFNDYVTATHKRLKIDEANFTMRYMNYVTRVSMPMDVFKSLVLSFESANSCQLIVGVNIVAPEDNEVSMRDYWLHMQMFKFCHDKFPAVKYSMHAGELTLGMVKPEDLTWHINAAVRNAKANRIGHGADMAYEHKCYDLLRYMADNKIAIEINLYSNEFILKIKDDQHPFTLYKEFNVPIVISSDDAGVLRSNLTHQFVLLAKRYKDASYQDIKKFVYNSIDYSFIKESSVRESLKWQLSARFTQFEKDVLAAHSQAMH